MIILNNKWIIIIFIIFQNILFTYSINKQGKEPFYLNPKVDIKSRVNDLMSRMTLEEKVYQMCQYVGIQHMKDAEKNISEEELLTGHARGFYKGLHSKGVERMVEEGKISSFLHVLSIDEANYLQNLAKKSRLKIPLLIGIDAIHGNGLVRGATIYPSPITMASSFSPQLVEKASRQTAVEMRATGSQWAFTPNIEIARDPRWGRVGETFGEDPYLVSEMGIATVKGLQTEDYSGGDKVIACVKHLLGGGASNNGTNGAPIEIGESELRNIYLYPFEKVIKKSRPFTLMPAHNEVNGIPSHANGRLMNDIVRGEYGFDGFIVSDWMDMEALYRTHKIAETNREAFRLSVLGGVDMHMHGPQFSEEILTLVKENKISEERINNACSKILESKFKLGLFENRYVNNNKASNIIFSKEHRQTSLELARKGIILLKNENDLLPIDCTNYKKILIVGPNANNQSIMGDWVFEQPDENVITIFEGIRDLAKDSKVHLVDVGWNLREINDEKIEEAVSESKKSDLAIVVVGEDSFREHWTEKTCGENRDRMDINLWGKQNILVEKIYNTGTPVIVILVNGRPLSTKWIADNIPVVIEAWEPGSMGGQALAEIIFGKINPSGKLPITIPKHVGQIPIIYNHKPTQFWHKYIDGGVEPLYPFGYGLSYTKYNYSNLQVRKNGNNVDVTFNVENSGPKDGEEIIQLYVAANGSSVTRPVKELKRFKRVFLKSGETKSTSFALSKDDFSFYNSEGRFVFEPGNFTIMTGGSSLDKNLIKSTINLQ